MHIDITANGDTFADLAVIAGGGLRRVRTVQGLGEDASRGGLADTACSREEVSMADSAGEDRVSERCRDVLLPDDFREALWTVTAGEHRVG